jgi:hypothetical protein
MLSGRSSPSTRERSRPLGGCIGAQWLELRVDRLPPGGHSPDPARVMAGAAGGSSVAAVSAGSPDPDERPDGTRPSASRSAAPASGLKEWPAPAWRRTCPDHSRDAATTGGRSGTASITARCVPDPARPDDGGGRAGQPNFGDCQGSRPFRPGPALRHRPGAPASPGPDRAHPGRRSPAFVRSDRISRRDTQRSAEPRGEGNEFLMPSP